MIIKSLELKNFRNYETLQIEFSKGTNILYGDNAQGKTNILEAIYFSSTTRSHKTAKDTDVINFNEEESHIRTYIEKDDDITKVDMHLRSVKSKGIAINNKRISKAADLLGILKIVFFAPEDLSIIKEGPAKRRQFVNIELCQLDSIYLYNLTNYNKVLNQRNKLLRDIAINKSNQETLDVWNEKLVEYGKNIIERRQEFCEQLGLVVRKIHNRLTGKNEKLEMFYEPNATTESFENDLKNSKEKDIKYKQTFVGPHRDDFRFLINGIDIRKFGSQGQQRSVALSLKLSEIELIKKITGDTPVLLLDDVLSELDSNRQNFLLDNIGNIQTIITCTGLDEFVNNRFEVDKIFRVINGAVIVME